MKVRHLIRLKELRETKNHSQKSFGEMLGVSQQTVAKWECGTALPKAAMLPKIADLLGCTIDDLFGRTTTPTDEK